MNIFALDAEPTRAAQAHCDTHVVKMILETAQLLSTAWHETHNAAYLGLDASRATEVIRWVSRPAANPANPPRPVSADGPLEASTVPPQGVWLLAGQRIYSRTHQNHPSAVWVRATRANYRWAWQLGMALLAEYTHRYGKVHATTDVLRALELVPVVADKPLQPFAQAMPDEYKTRDSVAAYRAYYVGAKADLFKYTRRAAPEWTNL